MSSSLACLALGSFAALASACAPAPGSIGAVLHRDPTSGALTLVEAPAGLGASVAGLEPGDVVLTIDGEHVASMTPELARRRLRGDAGTRVRLTVLRGDEVLHVEVERGPLLDSDEPPTR